MALVWTAARIAACATLVAACSAAPDDGAAKARSGVHGSPRPIPAAHPSVARNPLPPCGDGPYVDLALWLFELRDDGSRDVLPGATATFDVCPGYAVVTDEFGMATATLPRGVPLITRLSAPNHVTSIISQNVIGEDSRLSVFLPTDGASNLLPGFGATTPTLAVFIDAIGDGACASERGVTLRVVGHPEANVTYMSAGWPRDATPATTTSSVGQLVFFTGLSEGAVEIEGSKPGCSIKITAPSDQTGRFPLVAGAWTVGNVFVDD